MILEFLYGYFERPLLLLLAIPFVLITIFLVKYHFFSKENKNIRGKSSEKISEEVLKKRVFMQRLVLASRIFIVVMLCVALAYPYVDSKKIVQGEPRVKILFDNSSSMGLYNTSFVSALKDAIAQEIPVDYTVIANGKDSNIGDALIANLRKNENLLLITDGNVNNGLSLDDAVIHARELNATISAIDLSMKSYDSSVFITGPEKTTAKAENKFIVHIEQNYPHNAHVMVYVDGQVVADKITKEDFSFSKTFEAGNHKIRVEIADKDYFSENNIFYKTIKVVPKPKILFFSGQDSPSVKLLDPVYDVTVSDDLGLLNGGMAEYSAVVLNDYSAAPLSNYVSKISDFVVDGNGLFVVGGKYSYESGGYKGSRIEQLLPVVVGTGAKKKGDVNIVLLIDISGSTGSAFADSTTIDVEKALAVGVLRDLGAVNNVGIDAFNDKGYVVENVSLLLSKSEKELEDKILSLRDGGSTSISEGLLLAHSQLQGLKGSKNIILISDGKTHDRDATLRAANFVASRGTRVYSVGVGEDTDVEMMQKIADISGGNFFQPTTRQQLKIIFGETEIAGERKVIPVSVFDKSHFITDDLEMKGNIYGFNSIAPKQASKLLVATDVGDPILVVGRWGLGRVASLGTDDGGLYAGELLGKDNSRMYTKTMNWLIGDPERKNDYYLSIPDGFSGQEIEAVLKSSVAPAFKDINFIKFENDMYKAYIVANETGFFQLGNSIYAVNYNTEYLHPFVNLALGSAARSTNGRTFKPEEISDIIAFIKASSKREVHDNKNIAWIFVLAGLLVYLLEICYRRVLRNFF